MLISLNQLTPLDYLLWKQIFDGNILLTYQSSEFPMASMDPFVIIIKWSCDPGRNRCSTFFMFELFGVPK